jgi:hypothetical protein
VEGKEKWLSVYAPLGLRVSHVLGNGLSMFAEGGVKLPIYNENRADLSELYGVKVKIKPGRKASGFAEAGLKWQMLRASLFYEGLRFSKSDSVRKTVDGGTLIVWQPESEADIFGAKVGWTF